MKRAKEVFLSTWRWVHGADRRIAAILALVVFLVAVTGVFYWFKLGQNPSTHFGAVFASWVADLGLFILLGIVVYIYQLPPEPHTEAFDARARNLFKRRTGRHIDYIVERIKELEHYAVLCIRSR